MKQNMRKMKSMHIKHKLSIKNPSEEKESKKTMREKKGQRKS